MQGTTLSAIIVAAGQSTRFGQPGKVFQMLGEQTVLEWSIRAFAGYPHTTEIIIVGQPEDHRKILAIAEEAGRGLPIKVACGGRDRQGSVANGLALAAEVELISVHDAARPGVTSDLIARVVRKACEVGAAVAATPAKDTIKQCSSEGTVEQTLDRSRLWQIATPQVFRTELLREAHQRPAGSVTDDAGLIEAMGLPVAVVQADEKIAKITTQNDLKALQAMLGKMVTRVGFGYDIHQTDASRELWLGGVLFPEGPGLVGHSDADVICHAAADALLGAVALGDIGRHFPNTDPVYEGISSLKLLTAVAEKIREAGAMVVNVDITLIAERPKIVSRVDEMREKIANALGLDISGVSVKATTAESIGPAGKGECMEAHAVAQVAMFVETD